MTCSSACLPDFVGHVDDGQDMGTSSHTGLGGITKTFFCLEFGQRNFPAHHNAPG